MAGKDNKNYVAYADIARIMSAFAVVLLHVSGAVLVRESIGSAKFIWAAFFDCVTRWSVPLFVMLSGMLFLDKNRKTDIKKLYSKNILRLVTAFLFWSFVYNAYTGYANYHSITDALMYAFKNVHNGSMHLWYMFVIVGLYIVLPFVKRMCENITKREAEGFMLLGLLVTFVPKSLSVFESCIPFVNYLAKFEMNFAMGYTSLFVAGWYIDKFEHTKAFLRKAYALGMAGFIYMFVMTVYASCEKGAVVDSFMSFKSVSAFLMAFALLLWCKNKFKDREFSKNTKLNLKFFSKYTFGVYLVHVLIVDILSAKGIFVLYDMPYIGIPIEAICVFLAAFIVTVIINLLPFGKYVS